MSTAGWRLTTESKKKILGLSMAALYDIPVPALDAPPVPA
jgi:hypothetical protein